jgi:predicted alpha-1,2-mannosidase
MVTNPVERVNPLIGSGGHGHVFVGANSPQGMVQLGPHQICRGWDWCSGYHYSDSVVLGFSHTRLSGTGIGELGDILVMPFQPDHALRDTTGTLYARLSHDEECVRPGYYRLRMQPGGILAELTATPHVGLHRYTFPQGEAALLLDLEAGIGWDEAVESDLQQLDEYHFAGYRRSTGWARNQVVYFYAETSQAVSAAELTQRASGMWQGVLHFDVGASECVELKVGISAVSIENARHNLEAEAQQLTFEDALQQTQQAWNEVLGTISIEPIDERQAEIFYTALYHTMIAPVCFSDVSGDYRGADGEIHHADNDIYTIFSLWDTYRAASPLMTLIRPKLSRDVASTFLQIYREQGKLPVWHLAGNETDCMVGNPGVIVLGDLLLKGFVTEPQEALEAMQSSSMRDERGMELLKTYGYIPYDATTEVESVAKGLEFAIADSAVAKVAESLQDTVTANRFHQRSMAYRYYFDPQSHFMRGRAVDGSFREPFDPFLALHMRSDYTEGNAWQYTWLVPHDVHGLIALFGGEEPFARKLEEFFTAEGDLGPDADDVTGLIGQYAHGNEPSHHIAYLFNYVGQQKRCAELVRQILRELYSDEPDGICGNEDVGQMSAWYILSSLGLYQVDPVGGPFLIGSPAVKRAVLDVGEGRHFTIVAHNNSAQNIYVKRVRLNGKPYEKSYIDYRDIVAGGELEFEMSDTPSDFGSAETARP